MIDPVIHPLPRMSVCSMLAAGADWVEFAAVRDSTELSDSMLSKHSRALEDAGYVEIRKGAVGRRPRTWLRITRRGRRAFLAHVAALREMAEGPTAHRSGTVQGDTPSG